VPGLLNDAGRLQSMTAAAALAGHRDAAQRVAEVVLDVARSGRDERKRLR
jgi:UDP-N-acetylglucosamine--N-acetylmuramyl-(pentapeptide) pyrophosphoryl-undecaprenol N-acetylglucosamine transferase